MQLILLTLACTFQACSANRSSQTDDLRASRNEPIFLWRMTHPQKLPGQSIFLYGSIRAQPKDSAYLDKSVIDAISKSDRAYVIYDPSQIQSLEFLSWLEKESSLPRTVFLKDQISGDLYARLEKALDKKQFNGDYREAIKKMRPWRVALLLQFYTMESWGMAESYGSEAQVVAVAAQNKKPVSGLLDAVEQFKAYASASPKDQENQLEKVINGILEGGAQSAYRNSEEDARTWTDIYRRGDSQSLEASIVSMANDPKSQPYFKALSDVSRRMVQKIQTLAEDSSNTFIGIDVVHLAGPGNILDTLRNDGFSFERIAPQGKVDKIFTAEPPPLKKDRSGWSLVETPLFNVSLPAEPKIQESKLPMQDIPSGEMIARFFSVDSPSTSFATVNVIFPPDAREKMRTATPENRLKVIGLFIDSGLLSKGTITSSRVVDEPLPQSLLVDFKFDLGTGTILGFEVDGEFGYLLFMGSHSAHKTSAVMADRQKFFESLKMKKTKPHSS